MGELFEHDFISDQEMKLIELTPKERDKYLLQDGDLLFARRSYVLAGSGKCSLVVGLTAETTFESSIIRARPNRDAAHPRFYYYLFRSPHGRSLVASIATRTAVSGIRGSDLVRLAVPQPPLSVQCKIAGVLSAYDHLIESNLRRIGILEEMAQNLYREWFVEFRFPGHEMVRLADSEFGAIPEGWDVTPFTEIADVLSGGTPKTRVDEYWNGAIPFFTPKDAPASFYVTETSKSVTELGLSKCNSRLYAKDTVFITARGTVGRVVAPGRTMAMNQSCYALRGRDGVSQLYLFLATRDRVDYLRANTGGATFDTIVVDTFRRMRVVRPPLAIIGRFSEEVEPLFGLVLVLLNRNALLRTTRDLLLPKLISGEVDVSELDILTHEIAS